MKKSLLLSSALVLGTLGLAQAGGLPEPVMEPQAVRQQTSSSSAGFIVPVMFLILLAAVASGGGSAATPSPSDIRLKQDVRVVGMTPQGLPLYKWRYAGMADTFEGVLAQDVAMIRPDALVEMPFGYKAVDYARLGLTLRRVA